ncbi:MAG: glycoside hydrolase family 27 protein [Clostridia bacterium]|nr:glycoside hydrolase family 27 protein [Clostridia bacterium]
MKKRNHHALCLTPPMGWNSWDCYGAAVTEDVVRKNADYMAKNLKNYGWEYIIVDIQWYEPNAVSHTYNDYTALEYDEYSRLIPAVNRFPSSKDNAGFKPLSDYVHSLGLKFGIHILRGIARECVKKNTPIKGTNKRALDIARVDSTCGWNTDMYGVDPSKEGAQEYYNSLFELYASWGVDFVKVDDIARPYHAGEVELIRNAIDNCGRDMVLSLSPGAASLRSAEHLNDHANMWRMTDDFWDKWELLRDMFDRCRNWQNLRCEGAWPDCDMLPLGKLRVCDGNGGEWSRFTKDEQLTHMALWSIFRSPLFFGGDMTMNDEWTDSLMMNEDLIELNKFSTDNRELYRDEAGSVVWYAKSTKDDSSYIAQFNISDRDITVDTPLSLIGKDSATIKDLFTKEETTVTDRIYSVIPFHGVKIYKVN